MTETDYMIDVMNRLIETANELGLPDLADAAFGLRRRMSNLFSEAGASGEIKHDGPHGAI
ncbi:hypothetical protein ILP92_17765 [Maribius pontilimi]|uniref:Uncharacterized protein n=1 Tax=Palleronia pontilimi TaxID=1964209 RepID=A0A934IFB4_9RHOB|nr:hypothetical protein [Palleronia pontilimi]MBJ3764586.1 hypothetical protein [Palleronia pontilimi]